MPGPCKPFDPCWCVTHPTHPKCTTVNTPINGELIFLLIAGLLLGVWMYKKKT